MSEPHTKPGTWAKAAHGWTDEFFQMRLYQTKSIPHLREAIAYEKANKNRDKRIDKLNDQIDTSLSIMDNYEIVEHIENELEEEPVDREWIGRLNGAKQ